MTGQIPPYGEHFRLVSHLPYDAASGYANRAYVLKADDRYLIRSDRSSKAWAVLFGGKELATRGRLTDAMEVTRIIANLAAGTDHH